MDHQAHQDHLGKLVPKDNGDNLGGMESKELGVRLDFPVTQVHPVHQGQMENQGKLDQQGNPGHKVHQDHQVEGESRVLLEEQGDVDHQERLEVQDLQDLKADQDRMVLMVTLVPQDLQVLQAREDL
jgi:hypothetical protein